MNNTKNRLEFLNIKNFCASKNQEKKKWFTVWNKIQGFSVAQMVKNLPAMQETRVWSLGWEDPLEKGMAIHSVFLPGESHGQRSLVGYSLWSCKELNMTEWLTHTHGFKHSHTMYLIRMLHLVYIRNSCNSRIKTKIS